MSDTIYTAGLIVVKDNKLLLAYSRNKNAWYLPGGKIDKGENAFQSIVREIKEELNLHLETEKLRYYCHFTSTAYGEHPGTIMQQDCFMYDLDEHITPGNEIAAIRYFTPEQYMLEPAQVPGVWLVFERLQKDNILEVEIL